MDESTNLIAHAVMLMFIWVPFVLGAALTEHWRDESVVRRRRELVHPIRHMREPRTPPLRPAHG